jgi:ribosome-associated translation inhibitor RaiA
MTEKDLKILLEPLVKEYKKTKSNVIFKKIYDLLLYKVTKKATYMFNEKWYSINLYSKCKYCIRCHRLDNASEKLRKLICDKCLICECEKGTFNLKQYGLCDLEEVIQDLWIRITGVIESYQEDKKFYPYFESCLYDYQPSFINADFIKLIKNKPMTYLSDGQEKDIDIIDYNTLEEVNNQEFNIDDIKSVCKTKIDKELVELYLNTPQITMEEAGKKLNRTQQAISKIFKKLQKRLIKIKNKSCENEQNL